MNRFRKIKSINNQAFTLIELIVVISVISVLLAFSLPRLNVSFFSNNERKLSSWILLNVKLLKEKAVKGQTLFALNVDLDNNQMWSSAGPINEDEDPPKTGEFQIPSGYQLMDVEFPDKEKITKGVARIHFYKKGYSDKAIIHIEDDNNNKSSFLIEPFLPHVEIFEKYIEF